MADEALVPWFVPSLAAILGAAEIKKKSPLSAAEIVALRDTSTVIMTRREDIPRLEAARGYRDVNASDAPSDWFRLRVEMTGGYLPKIVWCFLGDPAFATAAATMLRSAGIEHEVKDADPRMTRAFESSQFRVAPSFQDADWRAIAAHKKVVYVVSERFNANDALLVSRRMLALAAELLGLGATALKCESSGIAHGRARWLAIAERALDSASDPYEAMRALQTAYVKYPIGDGGEWQSCGLHLLGLPDLIIASPTNAVLPLFEIFPAYLLTEIASTERYFASGNTFSVGDGEPRYRVIREACTDYEADSFYWNPFGRWRFVLLA